MIDAGVSRRSITTDRHQTVWLEAGPTDGPLMIFLHGWPELGLVWRGGHEIMLEAPAAVNDAITGWLPGSVGRRPTSL